jgi:hypothetical protein
MQMDIYAFDAGAIDGCRFYGSIYSDRFKKQFPNGFDPLYEKAKSLGVRLGVWGGPDGFGDTPEQVKQRTEEMVKLCRDYEFALFKFDKVCGPLRPEKEDAFINMMTQCRKYSPDLILLNHRLGLNKSKPHATTFLWEGKETYIDVWSANQVTAQHHRADVLSRGLTPDLKRLTEDHGVCISSCIDYWDDDLVLQAFNRGLILAPEIYGNPWLMRDDEFPKLARIYNVHKKYRDILINGKALPEEQYGPFAVSRGDGRTRLLTLRNLTWEPVEYTLSLDKSIGLETDSKIHCRQFHPGEKVLGEFAADSTVKVTVLPFRSCLVLATSQNSNFVSLEGCVFETVRDVPNKPVLLKIKGKPGETATVKLDSPDRKFTQVTLDGKNVDKLLQGKKVKIKFPGKKLQLPIHRKLADLKTSKVPEDATALYEATVFAADNNALEVRSYQRSGPTKVKAVKDARDAFFNQTVFRERGVWDKNMFDGDMSTSFYPRPKFAKTILINDGCFRLDLGDVVNVDELIIKVPDVYSLSKLLVAEGNYVEISTDLQNWETITFLADKESVIPINKPVRYVRLALFPQQISEIEAYKDGKQLDRSTWRASNLFSHPQRLTFESAWSASVKIEEVLDGSYLAVAINGVHGIEGAYAAARIGDKLVGAPDRAVSYPSNTWEHEVWRTDKNYTYYIPLDQSMEGQEMQVYVLGLNADWTDLNPEIWQTAADPFEYKILELE